MAAEIVSMRVESLPELRLIGKRCDCEVHDFIGDWERWFENKWFELLDGLGPSKENGGMYLGVTDDAGSYWIGLIFPTSTPAPDGFEFADIPETRFAVMRFSGKKDGELLGGDGINLIIDTIRKNGLTPADIWNGWCIERYSCADSSNGSGKVLADCLYELK